MKSLKPVQEQSSIIVPINDLEKYDNKIKELQNAIQKNAKGIEDLEKSNEATSITKENGSFTDIDTHTFTADSLKSDKADVSDLEADTIKASESITTQVLNTTEVLTENISTDTATIQRAVITTTEGDLGIFDGVNADTIVGMDAEIHSINSDQVKADTVIADTIRTKELDIDNLSVSDIEAGDIVSGTITSRDGVFKDIDVDEATLKRIYNQYHAFAKDEDNSNWFMSLDVTTDGSSTSSDFKYIELPRLESGIYRLVLRNRIEGDTEDDIIGSIIYSNTETTPLVQYSKASDGVFTHFFYHEKTNVLYIETKASGQLYWDVSAKDLMGPPKIYGELPVSKEECYRFNVSKYHGVVLLGDRTGSTALTVLGLIEGNFVKDDNAYVTPNFYSDVTYDLFNFARSYLRHVQEDGSYKYERAQLAGYLQWKSEEITEGKPFIVTFEGESYTADESFETLIDFDTRKLVVTLDDEGLVDAVIVSVSTGEVIDNVVDQVTVSLTTSYPDGMDPDHVESEALEKIWLKDDNTIVLTIDDGHGQDDIIIEWDPELDTQTSTLPFTLGFNLRSEQVDWLFNHDMFEAQVQQLGNDAQP